jgi:hypothetical protein
VYRSLAALTAAVGLALAAAPAASAGPDTGTPAVVSLGDSFISGEAGRWYGNSLTNAFSRDGTDRAYVSFLRWEPSHVYGSSANNGCHRSDVSEIIGGAPFARLPINIACSGAQTENVLRRARGGTDFKGEAPQNDQLVSLARDVDIEAIVLSIGGNDLGFSNMIAACVKSYLTTPVWSKELCVNTQQRVFQERLGRAMSNVRFVIDDVRAVMDEAGYPRDSYRFILQSYSSPVPRGSEMRYREDFSDRTDHGCPLWNEDLNWANGSLVPTIALNLRIAAEREGVEFLDLQDLLDGHEPCARTSSHGSDKPAAELEWARYVSMGVMQGDQQESFHPNAIGQRALGTCLSQVLAGDGEEWACRAGVGVAPEQAVVTRIRGRAPKVRVPQLDEHQDVGPERAARFPFSAKWVERAHKVHARDDDGPRRGGRDT